MRRTLTACVVASLLAPLGASAPRAQESSALVEEVAGLHRSLDQLVELLRASVANQRIDILLRRIELKERRLSPMERRLGSVQDEIVNIRSELARFEAMKERAESDLLDAERDGDEGAMNEARFMIRDLEQAMISLRAKLDELERRLPLLENELADGREELLILDEKLEELLD